MLPPLMLCFQLTSQLPGVTGNCHVHISTSSLLCALASGYASLHMLDNGLLPAVNGRVILWWLGTGLGVNLTSRHIVLHQSPSFGSRQTSAACCFVAGSWLMVLGSCESSVNDELFMKPVTYHSQCQIGTPV